MGDLRNPFAKRNGRIIYVADLHPEEYGHRCNCTCAFCGNPMLAVLRTKKKRPHFAHNGKGCSDDKSILAALLQMMAQHLEDAREIVVPGLYIGYTPTRYITERHQIASICPQYNNRHDIEEKCHFVVIEPRKVSVSAVKCHIEDDTLSFTSSGHEVGVVVSFMRNNCSQTVIHNTPKGVQYDSLFEIELGDIWDAVEESGMNALRHLFLDATNNRTWLRSKRLEKAYGVVYSILVRERERLESEAEARAKREWERMEKEREIKLLAEKERVAHEQERYALMGVDQIDDDEILSVEDDEQEKLESRKATEKLQAIRQQYAQREVQLVRRVIKGCHDDEFEHEAARAEMSQRFDASSSEKQIDSFGVRWYECEKCKELCDEEDVKDSGGPGRLNRGVCRGCNI